MVHCKFEIYTTPMNGNNPQPIKLCSATKDSQINT